MIRNYETEHDKGQEESSGSTKSIIGVVLVCSVGHWVRLVQTCWLVYSSPWLRYSTASWSPYSVLYFFTWSRE